MTRHTITLCFLLAAVAGTPAAFAGGAINKCTDSTGHVTLTDQPCSGAGVTASVAVPATPDAVQTDSLPDNAPAIAPIRRSYRAVQVSQARWTPATLPHAALASDVATLRQARLQMLLLDAAPRATLAVR